MHKLKAAPSLDLIRVKTWHPSEIFHNGNPTSNFDTSESFGQPANIDSSAIMTSVPGASVSKRRKFVADGVFYAELNEFFQRELAEEGYSGVEVRVTPTVTDISTLLSLRFTLSLVFLAVYSHPRNTHPRSPRRARAPHPRTDLPHPKTLQVPRELRLPLRRQGPKPWSLRCRPMRISALQAAQWTGCEESLLWCAAFHHGEWSEGM